VISIREGDWSAGSSLWTADARKELGFNEEDGSVFWMSFNDFLMNFKAVNICSVKNWQELRIKGKFTRITDISNPNFDLTISKWYYNIEIGKRTQLVIALHQEDERIEGVYATKPYIDVGIVILKKTEDSAELIELRDLVSERECEIEVILDPGSYIILPRTTGCGIQRPCNKTNGVRLVKEDGELNWMFELALKDIFRRYDMLLNHELIYPEFKGFYECVSKKITEEEFNENILKKYCSTSKGLTYRGFKDFFLDLASEEKMWDWLEKLGYDKELHPVTTRTFVLSFHSDIELAINVKDAVQTNLDSRTNGMIIEKFGQEIEKKKGVKAFYALSQYYLVNPYRQVHAYSYGVLNEHDNPIEATLDCSGSKNMVFSSASTIVKKVTRKVNDRELSQDN